MMSDHDYIEQQLHLASEAQSLPGRPGIDIMKHIFGSTLGGYMRLLPCKSQRGDHLVIVGVSGVALVVRRYSHDNDAVQPIGESYVHGMMMGEMVDHFQGGIRTFGLFKNRRSYWH